MILNFDYLCRSEIFDGGKFDEWVEMGRAPAIESSLKVYEEVLNLGFKVILLTGRSERFRGVTVENLFQSGFRDWGMLILRLFLPFYFNVSVLMDFV